MLRQHDRGQKGRGALASAWFLLLAAAAWLHATIVSPLISFWESRVLGTWEEVVTAAVRHGFQEAARTVNGVSAWLLSIFHWQHRASLQQAWQHNPWQKWWSQVQQRPNPLNALLATLQPAPVDDEASPDPATSRGGSNDWGVTALSALVQGMRSATAPLTGGAPITSPQLSTAGPATAGSPPGSHRGVARRPSGGPLESQQQGRHPGGSHSWHHSGQRSVFRDVSSAARPVPRLAPGGRHLAAGNVHVARPGRVGSPVAISARTTTRRAAPPPQAPVAMFVQQSGMGVLDAAGARDARLTGLWEDLALGLELRVAKAFGRARGLLRALAGQQPRQKTASSRVNHLVQPPGYGNPTLSRMRPGDVRHAAASMQHHQPEAEEEVNGVTMRSAGLPRSHSDISRRGSSGRPAGLGGGWDTDVDALDSARGGVWAAAPHLKPLAGGGALRRTASFSAWEEAVAHMREVGAGDVIRQAGYPLEIHRVTTSDGYVLQMERIPRHGSRDVVFFVHGVLDTSLSWVSAGVTGSTAFAAWDRGFDVWLANARCNAPRLHIDPQRPATSPAYWRFSINELGELDCGAQLEHIHVVKCRELGEVAAPPSPAPLRPLAHHPGSTTTPVPRQAVGAQGRQKASDSAARQAGLAAAPIPAPKGPLNTGWAGWFTAWGGRARGRGLGDASAATPAAGGALKPVAAAEERSDADTAGSTNGGGPAGRGTQEDDAGGSSGVVSDNEAYQDATNGAEPSGQRLTRAATSDGDLQAGGRPAGAVMLVSRAAGGKSVGGAASVQVPALPGGSGGPPLAPVTPPRTPTAGGAQGRAALADALDAHHDQPVQGRAAAGLPAGPREYRGTASLRRAASHSQLEALLATNDPVPLAPQQACSATPDPASTTLADGPRAPNASPWAQGPATADPTACELRQAAAHRHPSTPIPMDGLLPGSDALLRRSASVGPAGRRRGGAVEPYRLRAVGHSLGGMSLLIHCVLASAAGRRHRIHRLILLTPAGFHLRMPNVAIPVSWVLPLGLWLFRGLTWPWWRSLPGWRPALPLYIPTCAGRALLFKLMQDLRALPSLAELLRLGIKLLLSDDASQWDRALQMPHYGAKAMPAVSLDELLHMTQCARARRFQLFDYGSRAANQAVYGMPQPPDVAQQYWRLRGLPVDLVAGAHDGIIPPENVARHYSSLCAAGVQATYKEFEFGHLDFTFGVKDDLKRYLMRLLRKPVSQDA